MNKTSIKVDRHEKHQNTMGLQCFFFAFQEQQQQASKILKKQSIQLEAMKHKNIRLANFIKDNKILFEISKISILSTCLPPTRLFK